MSQLQIPDANELGRLRAVITTYEQRLAETAALVARVRHDINNPLAALLGQAQLLLREDLNAKIRRRAEMIEDKKEVARISASSGTSAKPDDGAT